MKVLIVTPLYPPDIAGSAPYVKEFARRLAGGAHAVTILAYSHLPEAVPGVRIRTVEKSSPLPVRIGAFTRALRRELAAADAVLVENGPSTELPLLLAHAGYRKKIVFHCYDETALARARVSPWHRLLLALGARSAARTLVHGSERTAADAISVERPAERPEILPFSPFPKDALAAYEQSWSEHVARITRIFETL